MPLINVVAGSYSALLDGQDLGLVKDDGIEIEFQTHHKLIQKTDSYAESLIDGYYLGATWTMRMLCMEFPRTIYDPQDTANNPSQESDPNAMTLMWPWTGSTVSKVMDIGMGYTGQSLLDISLPLILNALTGTSAKRYGPITLTASHACVDPRKSVSIRFGPINRVLPVNLLLLPYSDDGDLVWFTVT